MAEYGDVVLTSHDDGRITVDRADPVVGIAVELLAEADPSELRVTSDGHLSIGSDGLTLYRPVRFDPAHGTRVLICERVNGSSTAEIPIREATVICPGDHLIVRVDHPMTMSAAALMKERVLERMPLLADVTVIEAGGLAVFRDGTDHV